MKNQSEYARRRQFTKMLRVLDSMGITLQREIVRTRDTKPSYFAQYSVAGGVANKRRLASNCVVSTTRRVRSFVARWDVYQMSVSLHSNDRDALNYLVKHSYAIGDRGWDPEVLVGRGEGGVAVLLVYANQVGGNFIEMGDLRR